MNASLFYFIGMIFIQKKIRNMNINNVPISGDSYTLEYSFRDGGNSRSVTMSVDSSSSSWLSASVNPSTRLISITVRANDSSQRTGTITPVVDGNSCSLSVISVSQDGTAPPTPTGVLTCDQLISEFNAVLPSKYTQISQNGTPGTYNYLCTMYNRAVAEYDNGDLMKSSTYSDLEVFNYHGSNTTYAVEAENAMTSWVMAMCLAELVPDSGTTTNTQTELFKKAYNLGGGRSIPIYGNSTDGYYSPKGDVMLARIAASAVYSTNRSAKSSDSGRYTFSDIAGFRSELRGKTINEPSVDYKIGYNEGNANYCEIVYKARNGTYTDWTLGYAVNASLIFPSAAGPFITRYHNAGDCGGGASDTTDTSSGLNCNSSWQVDSSRSYPPEQVEKVSASKLFNSTTKNYLVDEKIYETVYTNYNLTRANSSYINRTVQAMADAELESNHMIANTTYYGYDTDAASGCYYYSFYKTSQGSSNGSFHGTFDGNVTGKDLTSLMSNTTPNGKIFDEGIAYPAESSNALRGTILHPQYGRRRPGEGQVDKTARHNDGEDPSHDHLEDNTISALVDGYTYYGDDGSTKHRPVHAFYDANGNQVVDGNEGDSLITIGAGSCYGGGGCPNMRAHTYPSGHSARIWGTTMGLMMMLPGRKTKIYKAGYAGTVSRTIVRAHWNSDTLYGKLIATMNVPVIYAISNWRSGKSVINYVQQAWTVIDGCPSYGGGGGTDITIQVRVKNNLSSSVSLSNQMTFYLANPDASGNYYGDNGTYHGCYNRNPDPGRYTFGNSSTVTVAGNGGTTSYYSITLSGSADWGGVRGFAPNLNVTSCVSGKGGPATLYDSTDTSTSIQDKLGVNTKIESDAGYKVNITFNGGTVAQCEKIVNGGKYTITIYS